jgi:hypothetical protein
MLLDRILARASNLLPLAGVWWWNWDALKTLFDLGASFPPRTQALTAERR